MQKIETISYTVVAKVIADLRSWIGQGLNPQISKFWDK